MKNPKLNSPSYCPRSSCFRHPSDPSTGICPSCLRDRLSGLDPSSDPPSNLNLTRSFSVSNPKDQPSCSYTEPRRASCDERNSLSHLLRSQDHKSRNVKLIDTYQDDEVDGDGDQVKTMKEFIDLEVGSNDRKSTNRNLFGASSLFRKRLKKYKDKQVPKNEKVRDNVDRRRRSCDTEPRFSIDALRGGAIEEGRASWDGYLVSRTIPSLAPMLYVVENGMLSGGGRLSVDGGMQAIMEDESSSGGSGVGNSDSLSSQRWSSFDRSSSVRSKKTVGVDSDEGMSVSSVKMSPTKLIVTERELKDWRLRSAKDDGSEMRKPVCGAIVPVALGRELNRSKKGPTWRKMFNVLGLKAKPPEKKSDKLRGISVDRILGEGCEKPWNGNQGELKDTTKVGGTFASSRKSCDMVGLDQSMRNGVDPKAKPSEKKHDNLKGMSVDRILGEECEKQWSEMQMKLKNASGCKVKVGSSIASARKSVDVVTLDRSTRNGVDQQDMSAWKLTRSGSVASSRSSIDFSASNQLRKSGDNVKESSRLARSGSVVSSRRSLDISSRNISERSGDAERRGDDFVLELNDNARKRTSKVDGEALPFYLMPLRSSRSGRHRS